MIGRESALIGDGQLDVIMITASRSTNCSRKWSGAGSSVPALSPSFPQPLRHDARLCLDCGSSVQAQVFAVARPNQLDADWIAAHEAHRYNGRRQAEHIDR
jgi:hypothetical protein